MHVADAVSGRESPEGVRWLLFDLEPQQSLGKPSARFLGTPPLWSPATGVV
jgi:hypothetical protein